MTTPPSDDLILRYLAGKLHGEDAMAVRAYLDATPERRGATAALWEMLHRNALVGPVPNARTSLQALFARLPKERDAQGTQALGMSARARGGVWAQRGWAWGLGAAALGIAGIAIVTRSVPHSSPAAVPGHVYATTTGQLARVTLGDGTRVTLAPRTTLRVTAFDDAHRTVTLDGEAHFDVATATGAPFIVRSGTVTTRVLGTQFLVRHYATDPDVRVAVQSGKVVVAADNAPGAGVTLAAGHRGIATDSSAKLEGDVARYTEWMDGQLVFRKAPASDVLATLTRWYGYEFRLAEPALAAERLTVTISTKSSADALTTLKRYLGVDLAFDGNVITVTPRRGAHPSNRGPRPRSEPLVKQTPEVGR